MTRKILIAILLCLPMATLVETATIITPALAEETSTSEEAPFVQDIDDSEETKDGDAAASQDSSGKEAGNQGSGQNSGQNSTSVKAAADQASGGKGAGNQGSGQKSSNSSDAQAKVDAAQKKLDKAKETEQSLENRMLGGLTTAATGLGAMQLAQGIAEKKADSSADKDMDAYIATMRCTYGNDKSVAWGQDPIELPGGNNSELMKYRNEYIALAASLKERKTALDLKPGIEAEEILDKATSGLYDDENTGITSGTYASRYRAAGGNEKDKKGLADQKKEAKTRMIAGGVVAGVGLVGGMVGNSLINGKLGELIKKNKDKKASDADNKKAIDKIKNKAIGAGLTGTDYIDSMGLESYEIGNYITIIDQAVMKNDDTVKNKTVRELCATPQIECLDRLLTKESRDSIVGAVKAQNAPSDVGMGLTDKATGIIGDKLNNNGNQAQQPVAEEAAPAPAATEQPAAEEAPAPAEE